MQIVPSYARPRARAWHRQVSRRQAAPGQAVGLVAAAGGGERADAGRSDLAAVRDGGQQQAQRRSRRCRASSGCRSISSWPPPRRRWRSAFRPSRCFPTPIPTSATEDGARGAQPRQSRLPGDARHPQGRPRYRHPARRRARSLHQPRPRRPDARRHHPQRRDGRGAGRQSLVQVEAGCDIIAPSDMMDGRVGAIRAGARSERPHEHADHGLRRQVCLGLLRPVPRRGRLDGTLKGDKRTYQMDPANTDEAMREVGARSRRGRRHGDGEARHALSRHRAARVARPSTCRRSPIRCRASTRC